MILSTLSHSFTQKTISDSKPQKQVCGYNNVELSNRTQLAFGFNSPGIKNNQGKHVTLLLTWII